LACADAAVTRHAADFVDLRRAIGDFLHGPCGVHLHRPGRNGRTMNARALFHILVVDDEPLAAEQVARFLDRPGIRTSVAGSGNAALALHREDPANLIVTDLRMPDGNGVHLIRTVRETDSDLPIVVVTGQMLREAEDEALDAGATALLRKPLDLIELDRAVKKHLPADPG
jgi:DNA-binding response OmpR family regulator